jgi:hypothetical protein
MLRYQSQAPLAHVFQSIKRVTAEDVIHVSIILCPVEKPAYEAWGPGYLLKNTS